jgi:hypothetical protein
MGAFWGVVDTHVASQVNLVSYYSFRLFWDIHAYRQGALPRLGFRPRAAAAGSSSPPPFASLLPPPSRPPTPVSSLGAARGQQARAPRGSELHRPSAAAAGDVRGSRRSWPCWRRPPCSKGSGGHSRVIRLKRIYNFLCSMLVFTPFALCFITLRGVFMRFPELTY